MSEFALTQISNIILGTTDLARSVAFYRDTLGLPLLIETEGFAFFNAGGVTLSLSTAHAALADPPAGAAEMVFGVPDVTAAHAALSEQGVAFMNAPRNVTGDQWAANFRDPDGHLLSVFGPEKA
ncbi:MAG: glyoxalase/bleomycin resistance/dioxygenase family protein [Acidobacteria bacterium]|jgi:catechol 2,3-dioxygenase-like lactoylglutathione lyase family enzyme|nr:glyoxalase/bleomycin resistance/dioxygenase family protein [Acidobacteriota bacterium]MDP7478724.1 VOC family protein [Vicinamibacterales bacterium]MDP7693179.1 VOC family protein [Vicinamibacterales bacterium]HJN45874.1 VOC family protein [Vicinamibacterales bacterium]|tara:strand:- start:26 stop:397 length:372 start_codon:yes stop_codon:yes gene_type:complete